LDAPQASVWKVQIAVSQEKNHDLLSLCWLCSALALYILRIFPKMAPKSFFCRWAKPERVWPDEWKDGSEIFGQVLRLAVTGMDASESHLLRGQSYASL
jgi:hypothetical protein